jgi:hypothetical protein
MPMLGAFGPVHRASACRRPAEPAKACAQLAQDSLARPGCRCRARAPCWTDVVGAALAGFARHDAGGDFGDDRDQAPFQPSSVHRTSRGTCRGPGSEWRRWAGSSDRPEPSSEGRAWPGRLIRQHDQPELVNAWIGQVDRQVRASGAWDRAHAARPAPVGRTLGVEQRVSSVGPGNMRADSGRPRPCPAAPRVEPPAGIATPALGLRCAASSRLTLFEIERR